MADTPKSLQRDSDTARLARERLVWAIKPFGLLAILLWILTPGTADRTSLEALSMLAFLFGALYGIGFYYRELKYFLLQRQNVGRNTHNRMPEEYYWGQVSEIRAVRKS